MSKQMKRQAGFTLVELAVVMIIIGLLIGGVLKGQELIGNAQVTSTVSQVKGVDAAVSTFRDMYNAMPGDMLNVANRLPNCTGTCAVDGDGNGRLDDTPGIVPAGEGETFFIHLSAADLLTGIDQDGGTVWGGIYPGAPIRGTGLTPGSATTAADLTVDVTTGARAGLYLTLSSDPAAAAADGLTPNQSARIDAKIDDGLAEAGVVRAGGTGCIAANIYDEQLGDKVCFLQMRIQG